MPTHHCIYVHAQLQLRLALRLIELRNLPPDRVVFLTLRGTRLPSEVAARHTHVDLTDLTAEKRLTRPLAMLRNREKATEFRRRIAPYLNANIRLYTSSLIFYHHQYLARRAEKLFILDDGLGSLIPWATDADGKATPPQLSRAQRWKQRVFNLSLGPAMRTDRVAAHLRQCTADRYFYVTPGAFPAAPESRKEYVPNAFPSLSAPALAGATIWCTSPCVEMTWLFAPDYLAALTRVATHLRARGTTTVHVKLHPKQRTPERAKIYLNAMRAGGLEVFELPPSLSVECLAAGTPIRLVCAVSSLALYVAAAGRPVFTYWPDLEARHPHLAGQIGPEHRAAVLASSRPLADYHH